MRRLQNSGRAVEATVGYAADGSGNGVAYARLTGAGQRQVLRVTFLADAGGADRATGYAALTAVSRTLCKRGIRNVRYVVADPGFVAEITTGRDVGEALVLPYVRLRCVLNSLATFGMQAGPTDDLTQRARAEAALNLVA